MYRFHLIKYLISVLIILWTVSCTENEDIAPSGSLTAYINSRGLPVSHQLIACASGTEEILLQDSLSPVSIFFLPIENTRNFQYFEAEGTISQVENNDLYFLKSLPLDSIFNGYLLRFLRNTPEERKWGKVVFETDDSLHICNPIHLKYPFTPTKYSPESLIISNEETLSPIFSWESAHSNENAIYFQVLADSLNNLLSGTYTFETRFQFYNLENVVLNIRDINPPPSLIKGKEYSFTLMGVSLDNWVNLIADTTFIAQ